MLHIVYVYLYMYIWMLKLILTFANKCFIFEYTVEYKGTYSHEFLGLPCEATCSNLSSRTTRPPYSS